MATRSRRKKAFISKSGIEVTTNYCRKCMKNKRPVDFFSATDLTLDSNSLMSVCKDCCNELYNKIYQNEHNIEKSILRCCKLLNVRYDDNALSATLKHLQTFIDNGKSTDNIFGIYKTKLHTSTRTKIGDRDTEDFTFHEVSVSIDDGSLNESDEPQDFKEYLNQFWGTNFSFDEYNFLEKELDEWKKTHKCDTKAEESLLKELCYKELEIRKARVEGRDTANLVKQKQELMKTASVDPAKAAMAGSGRSQDTFSSFIKIIEENEPADYYKDKNLFKDYDNIDWYFQKFVVRPLKNFVTQSRDFNIDKDDDSEEIDFDDDFEEENDQSS